MHAASADGMLGGRRSVTMPLPHKNAQFGIPKHGLMDEGMRVVGVAEHFVSQPVIIDPTKICMESMRS